MNHLSLAWVWAAAFLCIAQPAFIELQECEKQEREGPEARSSETYERQRNSDNGNQADGHADIDEDMEKQNTRNRIAQHPSEAGGLSLGKNNQTVKQAKIYEEENGDARHTPFFTNRAENKIGMLFRDKPHFCLSSLQKAPSKRTTGANRGFALVEVEAHSFVVFL